MLELSEDKVNESKFLARLHSQKSAWTYMNETIRKES